MKVARLAALVALVLFAAPNSLCACACGCGVFEVGTTPMLATKVGGLAYLEWDETDQNQNRSGGQAAPATDNNDKRIETSFFTLGVQYMKENDWGVMAELPYWHRYFKTVDPNRGKEALFKHAAVGDIRVKAVYTGLSSDMSTGLTAGLKLPTGDYTAQGFDRDTEIGTGSTDLLVGGYHVGATSPLADWRWFVNGQLDEPVLISGGYRPGAEVDAALGAYYGLKLGAVGVSPLAQLVASHRWHDTGRAAHFGDTGFDRVIAGPGVEVAASVWRVYGDVGFPIYQYYSGNQLVASKYFKLSVGYAF